MGYSTFQVSKALEIPRPTIQRWLEKSRISPDKRADGKGDKTEFGREDVYTLLLFQLFRDAGFSTIHATDFAKRITTEHDLSEEALRNVPYLIVGRRRDGRNFVYGLEKRLSQMPSELPKMVRPNGFMIGINLEELFRDAQEKLERIDRE